MSDFPEPMRRRIEELNAKPALDVVRDFLTFTLADAGNLDEVREDLSQTARYSTRSLVRELTAFETVLADPPDGLSRMVASDGNWVLDDLSDAAAERFLAELAQMLREVIETYR